jgi:hypothetical protein
MKIRVAVNGGACCDSYSMHHVFGYSVWEVRVNNEGELTSVKLIAENVEKPTAKTLANRVELHRLGII